MTHPLSKVLLGETSLNMSGGYLYGEFQINMFELDWGTGTGGLGLGGPYMVGGPRPRLGVGGGGDPK